MQLLLHLSFFCFKSVFIFGSVFWQVMMMFFPLVIMFLLPKLINTQDPETQRVCRTYQ